MANDLSINVGGTWKSIDNAQINVGGVWKQVDSVKINVAGVWKTVWENIVVAFSDTTAISAVDTAGNGDRALAGLRVARDGYIKEATGNTGTPLSYSNRETWVTPTSATVGDDFHVRVTNNGASGAAGTATGTFGSWLALTSDRTWTWEKDADTSGTATLNVTVAISDDGGTTTLDSVTFDINAQESV